MTACTGSTCPACTAAAAAMVVRPPSRLLPTPSAMHRSQSTCKYVARHHTGGDFPSQLFLKHYQKCANAAAADQL